MWDAEDDAFEEAGVKAEPGSPEPDEVPVDWRKELKERLGTHAARKKQGRRKPAGALPEEAFQLVQGDASSVDASEPTPSKPGPDAFEAEVEDLPWNSPPDTPLELASGGSEVDRLPDVDRPLGPDPLQGSPTPDRESPSASEKPRIRLSEVPGEALVIPLSRRPAGERPPLANPIRAKDDAVLSPLETPLKRSQNASTVSEPVRPRPLPLSKLSESPSSPQKLLDLEPPVPKARESVKPREQESPVPPVSKPLAVSREILVSRSLSGLIDLIFAAAVAVGFVVVGSHFLEIDFFGFLPLTIASGLTLVMLIVNGLYFLMTCGRTPGMAATGLRLVTIEGGRPSGTQVLGRSLLFLPCLISVVGLAWAILDPERRCAHDVLSGTLVISSDQD